MSTIRSSRLTASPGFLCQVATVPSATDSGKVGALISIAIISGSFNSVSLREGLNSECVLQQFFLLLGVHRCVTTGRRGRSFATGVFEDQGLLVVTDAATQVVLAAVPGALVHRLFLTPDHVRQVG